MASRSTSSVACSHILSVTSSAEIGVMENSNRNKIRGQYRIMVFKYSFPKPFFLLYLIFDMDQALTGHQPTASSLIERYEIVVFIVPSY